MIGFNHALTGGLIAKFMPLPLALPLAFCSHFVLDALPHYGIDPSKRDSSKFWKYFFTCDALATFGLAIWAIYFGHYTMFLGGLVATMPDFIWVAHVIRHRSYDFSGVKTRFEKWHIKIQRYEFPGGIWIELPIAAVLFYVVIMRTTG